MISQQNKQLRISTAGKHAGSRFAEIPICVPSLEPSLSETFKFSVSCAIFLCNFEYDSFKWRNFEVKNKKLDKN